MCALFWHLFRSLFLLKSHSPAITNFSLAMAIVACPEHYGTRKFSKKKFITSWESWCFEAAPKNDVRRRARNPCRLSGVTFASQISSLSSLASEQTVTRTTSPSKPNPRVHKQRSFGNKSYFVVYCLFLGNGCLSARSFNNAGLDVVEYMSIFSARARRIINFLSKASVGSMHLPRGHKCMRNAGTLALHLAAIHGDRN